MEVSDDCVRLDDILQMEGDNESENLLYVYSDNVIIYSITSAVTFKLFYLRLHVIRYY